jgi:putative colanic acid biosynthesis glycosyltransferase
LKVIQVNISAGSGSTGMISEEIAKYLVSCNHQSTIAAAHIKNNKEFTTIKIGNRAEYFFHLFISRVFDLHGIGSRFSTATLLRKIRNDEPTLVNLHNIHGYYLNYPLFFQRIKELNIPIVWTFHDCWPFTGHCSHFQSVHCSRWKEQCFDCPNKKGYPASWFIDNSKKNYQTKKSLFTGVNNMVLVAPCNWMKQNLELSFLKDYPVELIYNGIDLEIFKPRDGEIFRKKYEINTKKIVLGVSNVWTSKKGLNDIIKLRGMLASDYIIVLAGLTAAQIKNLPEGILGISRTGSQVELAELYSAADIFINPTYGDTFPTVNLESLACGTPVITYDTGGSAEAIDDKTGISLAPGDINGLHEGILKITSSEREFYKETCRKRAEKHYDQNRMVSEYLNLYNRLVEK